MQSAIIGLRDAVGGPLGIIIAISLLVFSVEFYFHDEALKEPGKNSRLLAGGNLQRFYVHMVSRALHRADSLLGDAGRAD